MQVSRNVVCGNRGFKNVTCRTVDAVLAVLRASDTAVSSNELCRLTKKNYFAVQAALDRLQAYGLISATPTNSSFFYQVKVKSKGGERAKTR